MHYGHDHHHDHGGGGSSHVHSHSHSHSHGHGHNQPSGRAAQWQTPHLPHDHVHAPQDPQNVDLDLVEAAFVEAFSAASDPTSFLRVAGVPFVGEDVSGKRLHLLRVETEDMVDVGSVTPLLGGGGVRYDPLPAQMTSRRRRLAFLYNDGAALRRLDFAAARSLKDAGGASAIDTSAAGA